MKIKPIVVDRQIVRPGDFLGFVDTDVKIDYMLYQEKFIYVKDNRVYSTILGIVNVEDEDVYVIPLEGTYVPRKDDLVVGTIASVGLTSWSVDIKSPYRAILNGSDVIENFNPIQHDLRSFLDVGDQILAKVVLFDRTRDPVLSIKGKDLGKITEGVIVEVKPCRVPRVIGRNRSMINMLIELSGCNIIVAQNGLIWIKCLDQSKYDTVVKAIGLINDKPHIRGLTEEVKSILTKRSGA